MPGTCVIGLQWGDEAKGKIVDLLTEQHDVVVRYQGGANAGHTVVTGGQTYKLSLMPSGILRPGVQCVVTGGVVLNPQSLLEEIDGLVARGVKVGQNLLLSDRAHVIFPWHIEEERRQNLRSADGESIGTTMRGIGPCYRDKVGRTHAIRLGDLYRPGIQRRIEQIAADKNRMLAALQSDEPFKPLDAAAIHAEYQGYAERLKPHVATRPTTCSAPWRPAAASCSKAPRGPCSTSTTAPSPSSPAATARASASPAAPACRGGSSTASSA